MIKNSLLMLFIVSSLNIQLSKADELFYYPNQIRNWLESSSLKNESLKNTLFAVLTKVHQMNAHGGDTLVNHCSGNPNNCYSHKTLTYSNARKFLFGLLHLEKDDFGKHYVRDVYCHKNFGKRHGVSPMGIPNSNNINCEHTWPQSKFSSRFSRSTQKSDLHHLYPTDSRANSSRGNYPFGEVDGGTLQNNCDSSSVGSPIEIYKNYNSYFEPPFEHRGNVARALFYFSVRYQMKINPLQEAYLKKWHEEDPIDQHEVTRNNEIMNIQGNRNPFIDFPHLVNNIEDF